MNGLRLFDYPAEFAALDKAIEDAGGELSEELEAWLDSVSASFDAKIRAYCALIKNYQAGADALKAEADHLYDRAQFAQRVVNRAKERLKAALEAIGADRADVKTFRVRLQASPPKVTLRAEHTLDDLPPEIVRVRKEVDKRAVLALWKENPAVVEGLFRVDKETHLRID